VLKRIEPNGMEAELNEREYHAYNSGKALHATYIYIKDYDTFLICNYATLAFTLNR
jgi:hypothetical protein